MPRLDPTHPRDRKIDREIETSVRLARLPLRELTVPGIARRLAPRRDRTVAVCLYVPPPYPQRPLDSTGDCGVPRPALFAKGNRK